MGGIRTRFAPSPTGDLHLGSARTALFAWLFARQQHGVFILRIEDTDPERSTQASAESILEAMHWLGLDYDEGPYYQTQRFERYYAVLQQLLTEGKAYRCYCSKERLENLRNQQMAQGQKPRYDGHCREQSKIHLPPYVIRFRNPQEGVVTFQDIVRGSITVSNSELDDLIIARSDGSPTYNFTVVVDDWDMQITHVIRGDDHINNTPRQINILQALGAALPQYGHVPAILGSDGKRLSKRHGAAGVLHYREAGYLPEALVNYLVRLGWSYGDKEIFSQEEMVRCYNVDSLQRSPAAFNPEKLIWLNQYYMKMLDRSIVARALAHQLERRSIAFDSGPLLTDIVTLQAERAKTLAEMAEMSRYFFEPIIQYNEQAAKKYLTADVLPLLHLVYQQIANLKQWEPSVLHDVIKKIAEEQSINMGKIAQPLRVAVTGNAISPPIDATLYHIGREQVLERLNRAIQFVS